MRRLTTFIAAMAFVLAIAPSVALADTPSTPGTTAPESAAAPTAPASSAAAVTAAPAPESVPASAEDASMLAAAPTIDAAESDASSLIYVLLYPGVDERGNELVFQSTNEVDPNRPAPTMFTYDPMKPYGEGALPWLQQSGQIHTVRFATPVAPVSTAFWFRGCSNLHSVDFNNLDTANVTTMESMFEGCTSLTKLDISGLDTRNVTSMENMFRNCGNADSFKLNVSGLDTSNVTTMKNMFRACTGVTELDVSGFDLGRTKSTAGMFAECLHLGSLDLSAWNTSTVTDMTDMFAGDKELRTLKLGANFSFVGGAGEGNAALYDIMMLDNRTTQNYTGNWVGPWQSDLDCNWIGTSGYLMANYDGSKMAGTYAWHRGVDGEESNSKYAFLYEDGDLVMQQGNTADPAKGAVVAKYTGFEEIGYSADELPPWRAHASAIKRVIADGRSPLYPSSTAYWFSGLSACTSINVTALDDDMVGDRKKDMFAGCASLRELVMGRDFTLTTECGITDPTRFGKWVCDARVEGEGFSSADLMSKFAGWVNSVDENVRTLTFAWNERKEDLSKVAIIVAEGPFSYTGSAIRPDVAVTYKAEPLVEGVDYALTYSANVNAGEAAVVVSGVDGGPFVGKPRTFSFTIDPVPILSVVPSQSSYTYDGTAKTPALIVTGANGRILGEGDYDAHYYSNVQVGTAFVEVVGKGNYVGQVATTFQIVPAGKDDPSASKLKNPLIAKGKTLKVKQVQLKKLAKLKKSKATVKRTRAFTVKKAKGKVTYKVVTRSKKAQKKIGVTKAGRVVLKTNLKKGTYILRVRVTAAGNKYYAAKSKIVKLRVKVV